MKIRTLTTLSLLVLMTACSQREEGLPKGSHPPQEEPPADHRLTRLAECSSAMKAVGDLYSSIASQQSGAQAAEMLETARERTEASVAFRDMAVRLAPTADRTAADVDRIIAETDAEIRKSSETMPFEAFATRAAGEADKCASLLSSR